MSKSDKDFELNAADLEMIEESSTKDDIVAEALIDGLRHEDYPSHEGDNGLEKVREILFGANVRGLNQEISALSEEISAKFDAFKEEQEERLNALEERILEKTEQLSRKISSETGERIDSVSELSDGLSSARQLLLSELEGLRSHTGDESAEIRKLVEKQAASFAESLQCLKVEMKANMGSSLSEMESKKTDKKALAELLKEVSNKLLGD